MYIWYQHAAKCYVYLEDVDPIRSQEAMDRRPEDSDIDWNSDVAQHEPPKSTRLSRQLTGGLIVELQRSRWFTRGWTLQELLAPDIVELYSARGTLLGTKKSLSLTIAAITRIPEKALVPGSLSEFSLQDKISWIQCRETLEEEDLAYCLMGLLGVWIEVSYGLPSGVAMKRLERAIAEYDLPDDSSMITSPGEGLNMTTSRASEVSLDNPFQDPEEIDCSESESESGSTSRRYRSYYLSKEYHNEKNLMPKQSGQSWVSTFKLRLVVVMAFVAMLLSFRAPISASARTLLGQMAVPQEFRPEIDASLPVFAILGKTGVGKSTFINELGGRNIKNNLPPRIGETLESCTRGTL